MTVTCLSCGAEYGQPHAPTCEFTIAVAPEQTAAGGAS